MTVEAPGITDTTKLHHHCEVCGKHEIITVGDAYQQGWDYPPKMGVFGVISPRTCGDCGIDQTLWFKYTTAKKVAGEGNGVSMDLTESQQATLDRIMAEPVSVLVEED